MIVVSAGMPRTASTYFFHVLRCILTRMYEGMVTGWCGHVKEGMYTEPNLLIKIHEPDERLAKRADIIFYSYRDVRDALASYKRIVQVEPTLEQATKFIKWDRWWRKQNPHLIRYEAFMKDPMAMVRRVCSILQYTGDPEEINKEANESIVDFMKTHPRHKANGLGGHSQIPRIHLKKINRAHKKWLEENGYKV